jgi:hypothetical protein
MIVSHEWTVSIEDVAEFRADQFLADLHALADNLGGQMVRGFLGLISDVSESTATLSMRTGVTSSTCSLTR